MADSTPTAPPRSSPARPTLGELARQVAGLANDVVAEARAVGRDDLADLLTGEAARWSDRDVVAVVAGEPGVGKSALVSALAGRGDLLPTGTRPTTAVVTSVRGSPPSSPPSSPPRGAAGGVTAAAYLDGREEPVDVPAPDLAGWVSGGDRPPGVARVDVTLAGAAIGDRLVVVDTPGVAGTTTTADRLVLALLRRADLLLFVTDPDAPIARPELDFLDRASQEVGVCLVAVARTDRFRGWQVIRDDTARILGERHGRWIAAVDGVSATLDGAAAALRADEPHTADELVAEAGVADLRARLHGLVEQARYVRLAGLVGFSARVADALGEPLAAAVRAARASEPARREELAAVRAEQAELRERGSATLARLADEVNLAREDLGVELRRVASEITLAHEERLLEPRIDPEVVLDAIEHDLRAAQLRVDEHVEVRVCELQAHTAERLTGADAPNATPGAGTAPAERRGARQPSRRDAAVTLRLAAGVASAGSGAAMLAGVAGAGLSYAPFMGISMLVGSVVTTSMARQGRQQKVLQSVRAQARSLLDEWQAATGARTRSRLLAAQRELEAAVRTTVRDRLAELDARAGALQEAAGAEAPQRRAEAAAAEAALARVSSLREQAGRLDGEIRGVLDGAGQADRRSEPAS